jgi:hypothetical protein
MTEKLKQEAEELIQRFEIANSMNCFLQLTPDRKQIGEMLVMIAEPREKRIAELEMTVGTLRTFSNEQATCIERLEAQIEKMKCCYNCKHSRTEYEHCKTDKSEKWEIKEK